MSKRKAPARKPLHIADLFCGAGGTSTGAVEAIEMLGFTSKLTAINHWAVAIATHTANHPDARHLCTGVDDIDPRKLFKEGELDVLWSSPSCVHHSVARGGKPVNDQSRATGWCVIRWAESLRPNVILVENVPEFESWGPIGTDGRPLKTKKGATFLAWVGALESLGYTVDWRVLCAADYGDPTTRRRLFVQAVRGRRSIVWPDKTHAAKAHTDLFGTHRAWRTARDHVIDWTMPGASIYDRKRPLSEKTMRRIMAGLEKFGLKPFVVPQQSNPVPKGVDEPLGAVVAEGSGPKLIEPFILTMEHGGGIRSADRPIPTVTTAKGGAMAVVQPFLVTTTHGNSGKKNAANWNAHDIDKPLGSVTSAQEKGLVTPFLLPQQSLGALRPVSEPTPTVATAGAIGLVEPFLIEYYGNGTPNAVTDPLPTVTCTDRHALVRPVVVIEGERYLLDIRFRMLQPHELAKAQGFRHDYRFTGTKTEQVKQIGNAVPRNLARAIVLAVLSQSSDVSAHLPADEAASSPA